MGERTPLLKTRALGLAVFGGLLAAGAIVVGSIGQTSGTEARISKTAGGESRPYAAHWIRRGRYRMYAREYRGREPAMVLMHGFPDDLHLYDRLVPYLRGRHIVLFDFLGWGRSDKPRRYAYTFENLKGDLDAVIAQLKLKRVVLVAHDASGPPAINWALDHQERVASLGLLNTFYGITPTIRPPEAIAIFADLLDLRRTPVGPTSSWSFKRFGRALVRSPQAERWLYFWQVGGFISNSRVRRDLLRKLWSHFAGRPSTIPAFLALNRDLLPTLLADTRRAPELHSFSRPVRIIFGGLDRYLNPGVARNFHSAFPRSDLFLLRRARHYVQVDEPKRVARLLLSAPLR